MLHPDQAQANFLCLSQAWSPFHAFFHPIFSRLFVLLQACENLEVEDSLKQRVVIQFDHCVGAMNPDCQDEILVYHLIACLYICLKTESRVRGMNFYTFIAICNRLPSYTVLVRKL